MNHPFRCLIIPAAIVSALVVGYPLFGLTATASEAAVVQPSRIDHLASRSVPLSQQERTLVGEYARHWISQLATGEPDNVAQAARRLRDPLNQIGVTAIFRDEYSRAVIPAVDELLRDDSTISFVAVNALQIAALLGTDQAMRLMVTRSDSALEQRKAVRIWAAQGFQTLAGSGHIGGRQLTNFLRDFIRAAQQETDWHVLLRQFEAINAVPDSMSQQLSLLTAVLGRLENTAQPSPVMQAVQRSLSLQLHQFIQLPASEQREFGISAGVTIGKVLGIAEKHWDAAHADDDAKVWYQRAVASAETLLKAMDAAVRQSPPSTNLDEAWTHAEQSAFQRDVQEWKRILGRQPYQQ